MNSIEQFFSYPGVALFLLFWSLFWKGWALWKAARKRQITWYLIILILNTTGLLEIVYIFYLNRFDLGSEKVLNFFAEKFGKGSKKK